MCYYDTMPSLLESLRRLGRGAGGVLLGQRREDVELGPEQKQIAETRRELLELQRRQLARGATGASQAARTAADEAIARLQAGGRSRVASVGAGPGRLLAARQVTGQEVAGRTGIERGVTQAAQTGEAQLIESLRAGLSAADRARQAEEDERERLRRKGLLPALTGALGALEGPQGAALGGTAGEATLRGLGR